MGHFSNLENNLIYLFLIVAFSLSYTLGMIFQICIFDYFWYCHFGLLAFFLLIAIIILPNMLICLICKIKFCLAKI